MSTLRINGADLYTEVAGTGEPVLLLHGGFCSLESLQAQAHALSPHYEVHAFERAGHGRSADIDGAYSYQQGVDDTLAYLDLNGIESVNLIGYSDGAIIGLLLALDHPTRVRSLVAISGNLDPSGYSGSPESVGKPMLSPMESPAGEERAHYERLSPDGPSHADVVLKKLFALWTSEPHIDPADLARVTAPVLVMGGDHDSIRVDHSLLIASSIPGAQLCIVPGATHGLVTEKPAFLSAVIREFLSSIQ